MPSGAEKEGRAECDQGKADDMVDRKAFLEPEHRKQREDGERNDFLHGLELCGRIDLRTKTVGGNRQTVLKKGDAPTDENGDEEGRAFVLEVTVPGERHEHVGRNQHHDRPDMGGTDGKRHDRPMKMGRGK